MHKVPFKRPKELASDHAAMRDVLNHGIETLYSIGYKFNEFVSRDCTAPFVKNSDVKGSIYLLIKKNCDAVVAAYKTHLNPYFNMMEFNSKKVLEFSKKIGVEVNGRQTAPTVFQLTSFQTINVKRFLKNKKIYTSNVLPFEISPENGLMIDTKYEFKIAECLAKTYFKKRLS